MSCKCDKSLADEIRDAIRVHVDASAKASYAVAREHADVARTLAQVLANLPDHYRD
jgi:hypothetical protein